MGICASAEAEGFQGFRDTGGEVRVLIVVLNYQYSKGNELTGIEDGITFQHMCEQAGVTDVTVMRDDYDVHTELFPSKQNVKRAVQSMGQRCGPKDYFVFFYAGHGENVPDADGDESDGMDEAFVTPGPLQEIAVKHFLIDDDFTLLLENCFNPQTKILCITDCCHSGSIVDVESHVWKYGHQICLISAAQDNEESADTGHGGILTISIQKSLRDLSVTAGDNEYSIQSVYNKTVKHGLSISTDQSMKLSHANFDPALMAWPLPHAWWKF